MTHPKSRMLETGQVKLLRNPICPCLQKQVVQVSINKMSVAAWESHSFVFSLICKPFCGKEGGCVWNNNYMPEIFMYLSQSL